MESGAGGFPNATAGSNATAGASGSGGSGGGGSMTVVPPPLSACMQIILNGDGVEPPEPAACAYTCHAQGIGSNALFGTLELHGDPGPRIIGKAATNSAVDPAMKSSCRPGALLVDVANPSKSVMLERVLGTQSCGRIMPDTPPTTLTEMEKTCFTEWINAFRFASANEITLPPEGSGGGDP